MECFETLNKKKGGLLLFLEPALFILVVSAYFSKQVKGFAGFHEFTMSSHDEKSDSAFSTPSGGVEVDTTSSLILGAIGVVRYFPKITPSDYNCTGPNCPSYQWQLLNSILTFLVAGSIDFPDKKGSWSEARLHRS